MTNPIPDKPGMKRARLFYFEEGIGAWCPCPDLLENIISVDNFLDTQDEIEIKFKTFEMTDAELDALPEDYPTPTVEVSEAHRGGI